MSFATPRPALATRRCLSHLRPSGARALATTCALWWSLAAAADELTNLSLEALMAVNVVGASKYEQRQDEVAAAVTVITREDIKAFGWRTLDEALAMLPGTHDTYDRQYHYLGVRGFALPGDYTTRVLVTLNGNRLNDPVYDGAPNGRMLPLDLNLIERIEFIPGPGGAVYGQNAMFGVVNIVTRSGANVDGGEVSTSWQWPQATRHVRASWGKRLDNEVDLLLSATAMRSHGENLFFDYGDAGISGVATRLDGERDNELFFRIGRGAWAFDLAHGDRRKDDPTGVYRTDPLLPGQYQEDRSTVAQLQYQDSLSDTLSLSARAFAGRYRYDSILSFDGAAYGYPTAGDWQGGELQLVSTAVAAHKWMLGLEYQRNSRIEQRIRDLADPANDLAIERDGTRYGIYVQDEWRLSETLTTTLGLRMDHNDITGTQYSPRVGLIWQARTETTLKALYGRAHRAPNAWERDYYEPGFQSANLALGGETIDTLELVADHRISRDMQVRASLYRWQLSDLIGLGTDPVAGLPQYQSFDKVTARGLELSALRLWPQGARLRTSLALQDVSDIDGRKVENSPRVLGKLHLSSPLPFAALRMGYELHYDGKRYNEAGDAIAGSWRSNLHLRAERLAKGLELSLSVLNLFDRRHAHPSGGETLHWQPGFEQDGRSVRLALDYRF